MLFLLISLKKKCLLSTQQLFSDTTTSNGSSNCFYKQVSLDEDDDGEILQILDDLLNPFEGSENRFQGIKKQINDSFQNNYTTSESRLTGSFCSETIFSLSHRMLTDAEIEVLEKGLDFASIQRKINEPKLKQDFNDFCRKMRLKCILGTKHKSLVNSSIFNKICLELSQRTPLLRSVFELG